MFTLFLLLMAYPLSFHYLHEIFGVIFTLFLGIHTGLNWWWYKSLFKRKYNLIRKCHTMVNLLLVVLILVNIVSALGISQSLLVFLPIDWGLFGRNLHVLSAYWGMIILAIHIGFHWDMLMAIARKIFHLSPPQIFRTYLLRLLSVIIAIYGLVATVKLEIGAKLIAYYAFSFYDDSQSYWWLLLDYFAFCGLCVAFTHYGVKLLRNLQKNNSSRNNITI